MRVNLNEIGLSFFRYNNNTDKENLSKDILNNINGDLVSDIRNKYAQNFTESPKNTIEFLKALLEYCYVNNIDLNDYISLSVHEKI